VLCRRLAALVAGWIFISLRCRLAGMIVYVAPTCPALNSPELRPLVDDIVLEREQPLFPFSPHSHLPAGRRPGSFFWTDVALFVVYYTPSSLSDFASVPPFVVSLIDGVIAFSQTVLPFSLLGSLSFPQRAPILQPARLPNRGFRWHLRSHAMGDPAARPVDLHS